MSLSISPFFHERSPFVLSVIFSSLCRVNVCILSLSHLLECFEIEQTNYGTIAIHFTGQLKIPQSIDIFISFLWTKQSNPPPKAYSHIWWTSKNYSIQHQGKKHVAEHRKSHPASTIDLNLSKCLLGLKLFRLKFFKLTIKTYLICMNDNSKHSHISHLNIFCLSFHAFPQSDHDYTSCLLSSRWVKNIIIVGECRQRIWRLTSFNYTIRQKLLQALTTCFRVGIACQCMYRFSRWDVNFPGQIAKM